MRPIPWQTIVACGSIAWPASAGADMRFADVSLERGIGAYVFADGIGSGVAAADFDNDGDIDVFVPNGKGAPDQLYRNRGDGTFEEIAPSAGVASTENNQAGLWFDYDADHDLDLLVTSFDDAAPSSYRLFRQDSDAVFSDVTQAAGLSGGNGAQRGGSCAGDINNDGYLDLLTLPWGGEANLFLNNQDGTFSDISVSSRLGGTVFAYWQPMMADFNGDGWLDIYIAVDVADNMLWINQRDNSFLNLAAEAQADYSYNDMGLTISDYDGDADLDIYVSNIFGAPCCPCCGRNLLLRNDTVEDNLLFTEVSEALGVNDSAWGWGVSFMDGDNDGFVDIAATNGFTDPPYSLDTSRLFKNSGGSAPTFSDVSEETGFNDAYWGSGLVSFDADRDGDLDLLQVCGEGLVRLLDNQLTPSDQTNYLVVQPRMEGPNHFAIAATVQIRIGETRQMRLISAGSSLMSQEPAEAWFGLGAATLVDEVTVVWPDGTKTVVNNICANQVIELHPGDTEYPPYAIDLQIIGPTQATGGTQLTCSSEATRCDGASDDVTAESAWEIVEGADVAEFVAPGVIDLAELSESQLITLRASFEGLESLSVILIESADAPPEVDQPPLMSLLSPSASSLVTTESEIVIEGAASDDVGIVSVVWSSDRGGTGPCTGTNLWTTSPIPLMLGLNVITITSVDTGGETGSLTVTVERTVDLEQPPAQNENDNIDTEPPMANMNQSLDNVSDVPAPGASNDNDGADEPQPPFAVPNANENEEPPVVDGNSNRVSTGGTTCGLLGLIELGFLAAGLTFVRGLAGRAVRGGR